METVTPYLAFVALVFGTMGAVFTFTPKGFKVAVVVYNFLERRLWHREIYAELRLIRAELEEHIAGGRPARNEDS